LQMPQSPSDCDHAWQSFVTVVGEDSPISRDQILKALKGRGIGARPGTHCVPSLEVYRRRFSEDPDRFPVSMMLQERSLALPLHNRMNEGDYSYVVECLKSL
ncbi:MAG: DegT/DnrJ/EryC1/StrS family aminotransferase, partial [Rubrobacteraceae bacterium]|nr:DegT/DnrJ/EryC1/StrS family aminotransferase [Rubrobacteraceae bacterium]